MSAAARILVVDDEVAVQGVMADVRSESGYHVEAVGSAAAALEALGRDAWDLVIADVRLGDRPGPELAREIARRQPALSNRIIFCTGDLTLAPTSAPVIYKPFSIDNVLEVVGARLSSPGASVAPSEAFPGTGCAG